MVKIACHIDPNNEYVDVTICEEKVKTFDNKIAVVKKAMPLFDTARA